MGYLYLVQRYLDKDIYVCKGFHTKNGIYKDNYNENYISSTLKHNYILKLFNIWWSLIGCQ